eukprot:PhM_4_TR11266/c0_g1_i1/m.76394/K00864/glpK, GK; glycerol kinase
MRYIASLDQGTTSTRCLLFAESDLSLAAGHQLPIAKNTYPHPGWYEQDPEEYISNAWDCMEKAAAQLPPRAEIVSLGITNQRETAMFWNRKTLAPLTPAIVWSDVRTQELVDMFKKKDKNNSNNFIRERTGLPIATYFSALKLRWLIDNTPKLKQMLSAERYDEVACGTVECWIAANLTNGASYCTDVTNASRTLLMNIRTLSWDQSLCDFFGIPIGILPQIVKNNAHVGVVSQGAMKHVRITGMIGDQQSACVGQMCFSPGETKSTYGTGCFLMANTGDKINVEAVAQSGLLATVCYQMENKDVVYAVEGSVAVAGAVVSWLKTNMKLLTSAAETDHILRSTPTNGDVYFVPSFSGLFAPHWDPTARGSIVGMSLHTTRAHVIRAALEAVCYQTKDVLSAMSPDPSSSSQQQPLAVDGGMTANHALMQIQANILQRDVIVPQMSEITALGAAICAGIGAGCWGSSLEVVKNFLSKERAKTDVVFTPEPGSRKRAEDEYKKWLLAVSKSRGWIVTSSKM